MLLGSFPKQTTCLQILLQDETLRVQPKTERQGRLTLNKGTKSSCREADWMGNLLDTLKRTWLPDAVRWLRGSCFSLENTSRSVHVWPGHSVASNGHWENPMLSTSSPHLEGNYSAIPLSGPLLPSPWRYFLMLGFESPAKNYFPLCMVILQYSKDICSSLRAKPKFHPGFFKCPWMKVDIPFSCNLCVFFFIRYAMLNPLIA